MSDQFIAEIRMFSGNFAPTGWALCNGQLMSIAQNSALFSLIGVTYGGDGRTTFALPNLQGSTPMQPGQGPGLSPHTLGEVGGTATVTLRTAEMPMHNHGVGAVDAPGNVDNPTGARFAQASRGRARDRVYGAAPPDVALNASSFLPQGGSQPHNNMQPYLAVTFIIALEGIYPTRP